VGYFIPIRALGGELWHLSVGPAAAFWLFLYSLATYGNAGFLREQVCKYMCPYARFQSAMFDRSTLIIAYDQLRGEPRGARRRGTVARAQSLGDCIDCTLCVQVCPTGIDIRHGLQNECIACGACIDACDEVMDKMDSPRGLIRYTTEDAALGLPVRIVRPRTIVYATLLLAISGFLVYSLLTRMPLIVDVIRDRDALYREVDGESIENTYTLKLINLDGASHAYRVVATGLEQLRVAEPSEPIRVPAGTVSNVVVRLQAPEARVLGVHRITLSVMALDRPRIQVHEISSFIGPRS
jgi:cytochrome c oxidase accessory protein FixG